MSRSLILARLLVGVASFAAAPASAHTYGESLLAARAALHPGVTGIRIDATDPKMGPVAIVTGTIGKHVATVPLSDGLGQPIGTVSVSFRRGGDAAKIATELAHRIYSVAVLSEADPFVDGAVTSRPAQALVERAVDRDPALVTLALHVALPGTENRIVASNFGRIGKAADKDDAHVIADGAILKEPTNGGKRLAVELPLLDSRGRTIGALSTSYLLGDGLDVDAAYARAVALRDTLAEEIPSLAALADG